MKKGAIFFAHPNDIRKAIDYALEKGQDKAFMAEKPGEVMGHLAYGHPVTPSWTATAVPSC